VFLDQGQLRRGALLGEFAIDGNLVGPIAKKEAGRDDQDEKGDDDFSVHGGYDTGIDRSRSEMFAVTAPYGSRAAAARKAAQGSGNSAIPG
jgi:hypothetical protein